MSVRSYDDLPGWVWQMVDTIDRYEDTHPTLYRMTSAVEYEKTECLGDPLTRLIPDEVLTAVRVARDWPRETPAAPTGGGAS
jgi:hypothetical protein